MYLRKEYNRIFEVSITIELIKSTVTNIEPGKSPGQDCITPNWKAFESLLSKAVMVIIRYGG